MPNLRRYVISYNRPMNVASMAKFYNLDELWWVVGNGQAKYYQLAGAKNVIEGGGLVDSHNLALDHAFSDGSWCLGLADDLASVCSYKVGDNKRYPLTVYEAEQMVISAMEEHGAYLGGIEPTGNPLNVKKPVSLHNFIIADFYIVKPTHLRVDPNMRLKQDYDYTMQHIAEYGKVARCNTACVSFAHKTNHGGAVEARTDGREEEAALYLINKWPYSIRPNPRRANEVILHHNYKKGG